MIIEATAKTIAVAPITGCQLVLSAVIFLALS
jgi:hypothetical protein